MKKLVIFGVMLLSACDPVAQHWTECTTIKALPPAFLQYMKHCDVKMADFNAPYDATDVVHMTKSGELSPDKRIQYLARSGDTWQLTFRHGGIGMHWHFCEFETVSTGIRMNRQGVSLASLDNRQQLDVALAARKIGWKSDGCLSDF